MWFSLKFFSWNIRTFYLIVWNAIKSMHNCLKANNSDTPGEYVVPYYFSWQFADPSGNQLLINFKHLIGVKINLVKFTYPRTYPKLFQYSLLADSDKKKKWIDTGASLKVCQWNPMMTWQVCLTGHSTAGIK